MKDDQNPSFLMSPNDDEQINDDNDRFLEEMLAKAARLANEMKEISTKQSTTTSSKSSTGKDRVRRSLPKVINVQPNDDHTARSECSSLGYSLATATPSVFVVNNGTSNPITTPTTMNLLSTTIENCAEGYFLKSQPQSSSTTKNICSVINEGSVNNDHDEKKSCGESVSATKPTFHIHKFVEADSTSNKNQNNNTENIQNMSSVDMLIQQQTISSYLRTPPKVKRTSQHQLESCNKLPLAATNPALQSTLLTTKLLLEEVQDSDSVLMLSKVVPPPHAHERPTVLKISQNDDDYVPIADYSIRNTTTTKASNTSAVKWEKITSPSINDDDYVSLKDYSRFPKTEKIKNQSRFVTEKYNTSTGLSFAQKRELLIKRRRQRKRLIRRLMIVGTIATSMLLYFCYRNDWFHHPNHVSLMAFVVNYFLPQLQSDQPGPINKDLLKSPIETMKYEMDEIVEMEYIVPVVDNASISIEEVDNMNIDNETLAPVNNSDHPTSEQSQPQLNVDDTIMVPSNAVGTQTMTSLKIPTGIVNTTISETLSIFEPKSRQRFVEELINSMMQ